MGAVAWFTGNICNGKMRKRMDWCIHPFLLGIIIVVQGVLDSIQLGSRGDKGSLVVWW